MTSFSKLPPYLPYPRFLLYANLTQAAKTLYAILLDRANLSMTNDWQDSEGKVYIIFPIRKIADAMNRSTMTVKNALTELETAGLIERQRQGISMPNRIFVKIPDGQDIVRLTDKKLSVCGTESYSVKGQESFLLLDRKLSPNNLNNNNMRGVSEHAPAQGRYKNVFISDLELAELQAEFPAVWQEYIERLSEYMASVGKDYKNHAATIRHWIIADQRKAASARYDCDYSVEEGETV